TPPSKTADEVSPREDSFVGRGKELERLLGCWTAAAAGRRQIVFLGGDAGIGKTTLTAELLRALEGRDCLIAQGTAVETRAPADPPLPFFSAVDDVLARRRDVALPLLERCAPSWFALMPWVAGPDALPARPSRASDGAPRLLREGAALWEAMAAE